MDVFPYTLIDLTHTLNENAPTWDGLCGFKQEITNDYGQTASFVPFSFRVQQLTFRSGIGTHIDAPAHCFPSGLTIDALALSDLAGPCSVIDISHEVHERSSVSREDVLQFEKRYGTIPPKSMVMIRTGWDRFWDTPQSYRNNNLFPSVSEEAASLLMDREIIALGIDCPSPDRPEDGYPVHSLVLGANKYIIENVTNLKSLPPSGSFVICLPLKTKDGSEAPARLIGLVKK